MAYDPGLPTETRQPRDSEGPVFREPWEASAFAMVVKLHENGHFDWSEWVKTLSQELAKEGDGKDKPIAVNDDSAAHYYEYWLEALEKIAVEKTLLSKEAIDERHRYLIDNPVPHAHVARRTPVKIA
jgi:nitrile hydratase accessory protein